MLRHFSIESNHEFRKKRSPLSCNVVKILYNISQLQQCNRSVLTIAVKLLQNVHCSNKTAKAVAKLSLGRPVR